MTGDRLEEIRAKAKAANVNERTLLATDYLNHFNEPMMLLELVPDMPECIADLDGWEPICYEDHFRNTNFTAKDVAIEAYELSPPEFRQPFDSVVRRLGILLQATIAGASAMVAQGREDAAAEIIHVAMPSIRHYQETAGAIINGAEVTIDHDEIVGESEGEGMHRTLDQDEIDSLLGS